MKTILPTENYIFAKFPIKPKATASGILLSKNVKQQNNIANVINVGSAVTEIKSKDTIYFLPTPHSQNIELEDEEYLMIHKDQVQGIVKE
jgi:co-chaperonin GroES (HSP10)